MVPEGPVEELVRLVRWFVLECGTVEVTHAGLLNRGVVS